MLFPPLTDIYQKEVNPVWMSHGDGGSTKHSQSTITVGRFSMWKTDSVMSRNKISQQFQCVITWLKWYLPGQTLNPTASLSEVVRGLHGEPESREQTSPAPLHPLLQPSFELEFSIAWSMSVTGLQNSITCSSHLWCVSSDITAGCTDVSLTFGRGSIVSKLDQKPRKGRCVGQWCSF